MTNGISLEDTANEINRGVNAVWAIYTAMDEGPCKAEDWLDGLHFAIIKLDESVQKLRKEVGK